MVMAAVVAPFDHTFPVVSDEVSTTLPPLQNVVVPPAEITGAAGIGFTVTSVTADTVEGHPSALTKETL